MDQDKIRTRWFEYISELYKNDSRGQLLHIKPDTAGIPVCMEVFSVGGGDLLDRPCMVFQRMCVVPVIPVRI